LSLVSVDEVASLLAGTRKRGYVNRLLSCNHTATAQHINPSTDELHQNWNWKGHTDVLCLTGLCHTHLVLN